jgi:archaellum component FlaC
MYLIYIYILSLLGHFLVKTQDAAVLIQNVNKKADQDDVSGIEANLIQVSHQLGRLNEVLQTQNTAIRDLNSKVTMLTEEVEDLRNPNYDQIFSYVDRQVCCRILYK